jgi:hypothetical protein
VTTSLTSPVFEPPAYYVGKTVVMKVLITTGSMGLHGPVAAADDEGITTLHKAKRITTPWGAIASLKVVGLQVAGIRS